MKTLWDITQAFVLVILIGAAFVAIPIIGLLLGIAGAVAIVFMIIKEERESEDPP